MLDQNNFAFKAAKSALLMAINSGVLDGVFKGAGTMSAESANALGAFVQDLQTVYNWKRSKGDAIAAGDFRAFVRDYLNGLAVEVLQGEPLPIPDLLHMAGELLSLVATVPTKVWASGVKDPKSFVDSAVGARFIPFGRKLAELSRSRVVSIVEVVRRDIADARAWANISTAN